jgi:predicted HNH restriction endonuclease
MTSKQARWRARERDKVLAAFGNKCEFCGKVCELEMHHEKPTGLVGRGRGSRERLNDWKAHPDHFKLLCGDCHDLRHREMLEEGKEIG